MVRTSRKALTESQTIEEAKLSMHAPIAESVILDMRSSADFTVNDKPTRKKRPSYEVMPDGGTVL
jgi:hypothetical protein